MAPFKHKTHILAILDRSGSMARLEQDTIGGYNTWLEETKKASQGQDVVLTLHLFDTQHEFPHIAAHIEDVPKLDNKTYYARGGTALLDAIGRSLSELKSQMAKKDRAIVLIITDGQENSSYEYTQKQIAKMISSREKTGRWSFTYLGANQDAFKVAQSMGMSYGTRAVASPAGTSASYAASTANTAGILAGTLPSNSTVAQDSYDEALKKAQKREVKS